MRPQTRKSPGFTLTELLVTIAIVVVLLALAAPSFRTLILNQRIKTASFELFAALNYARSEAIKRNVNVTLRPGAAADGAWGTGWRIVDASNNSLRAWSALPSLTVTESANDTATPVTYGRDGRLISTAPVFQISASATESGVTSRCIRVDMSGRASSKRGNCS